MQIVEWLALLLLELLLASPIGRQYQRGFGNAQVLCITRNKLLTQNFGLRDLPLVTESFAIGLVRSKAILLSSIWVIWV